jgi:phosphatidate cytidylyltransferase
MKELFIRTVTGVLFIILIIGSLLIDKFLFAAVLGAFLLMASHEWLRLLKKLNVLVPPYILYVSAGLVYISFVFADFMSVPVFIPVIAALLPVTGAVLIFSVKDTMLNHSVYLIFGTVYLAVPFGLLVLLHRPYEHFTDGFLLLFLFAVIWAYDTFAYVTGKLFGKHKLIERISPSKTWEGLLGGAFLTLGMAFLINRTYLHLDDVKLMGAVILIVVFSTFGDLFESAVKRNAGVKDSGTIFPGHGGVLDRFDSVFFAVMPFFVYVLLVFN